MSGVRVKWAAAAGGAVLIALVALLGLIAYVQTHRLENAITPQITAGQAELEAGKGLLVNATKDRDPAALQQAQQHFQLAHDRFVAARSQLASSKLANVAGAVPLYAGPRVTAARNLADAGVALANAAQGAATIDGQLLGQNGTDQLLRSLEAAIPSAQRVQDNLSSADRSLHGVDRSVLPDTQGRQLQKDLADVDDAVAGVKSFPEVVNVLSSLLGVGGAKTYLVEQVNPSELRPGGGFIGTYSVIGADQGKVDLLQSGDAYDIGTIRSMPSTSGAPSAPQPLSRLLGVKNWTFWDSNFSPDFPANARTAEQMLQAQGQGSFDGVIAIDYYAVAEMLGFTGSLQVPGLGMTVTQSDFVQQVTQLDLVDPNHKSVFSALAGPLLQQLVSLPASRLLAFGGELNRLATERHLQVYFNDPKAEGEVHRLGQSGTLNPTGAGDFMAEIESNVGASKANYFLDRKFTLALSKSGNTLHHSLQVDLTDRTPTQYATWYRCYVTLDVPKNATNLAVNGASTNTQPLTKAPAGTKIVDGWFQITVGPSGSGSQRIELDYDTPWTQDGSGAHSLYWQKQAGPAGDPVHVIWHADHHTYQASSDLSQDRVVNLRPDGVHIDAGRVAQGGLSSLGF
ncbi:MAG: DUF4012 domain-containing protein [Acidimicrobiaceae bacterium]|nr:DUF4012 domain-containing protein [Acidimicrobiaceae bacterium]